MAVQSALAGRPGVLDGGPRHCRTSVSIRWAGSPWQGWVRCCSPGAARQWITAGAGAFAAHAAAVLIKRVVRRTRPDHPAIDVNVGTPSRLSFPSAHATSTTAAAMLMGRITGLPLPALLIPPMALSRLVLGVHYPSDVVTGVVGRSAWWRREPR